jgi:hypothetical protein
MNEEQNNTNDSVNKGYDEKSVENLTNYFTQPE